MSIILIADSRMTKKLLLWKKEWYARYICSEMLTINWNQYEPRQNLIFSKLTYSPDLKTKECLKYFNNFGKNLKTQIANFDILMNELKKIRVIYVNDENYLLSGCLLLLVEEFSLLYFKLVLNSNSRHRNWT